jgi:hypothetical protein
MYSANQEVPEHAEAPKKRRTNSGHLKILSHLPKVQKQWMGMNDEK